MAASLSDFEDPTSESRLRLQTSLRLRWFAVAGQLLAIAIVSLVFGFAMPVGPALAIVAASAWLNVLLRLRYPPRHWLSVPHGTGLLAYDTVQLGALLYLTGGIENPFMPMIVAPVLVSASSLPSRSTILLGVLAGAITLVLAVFHLPLPWIEGETFALPALYKWGILVAILTAMTFQALYAWRLTRETRLMSAALAATEQILAREQKLHALDGLAAAAAHELGTPLATITLVAKELSRDVPAGSPLADDLALLQSQAVRCREILQKLTRSPSGRDPLHAMLTVTQLIEEAVDPYKAYKTKISIDIAPAPDADERGRREPVGERKPGIIYGVGNLLENAIDFARNEVRVTARWSSETVTVTIVDDGPGFPPELIESLGDPYVTSRPSVSRAAKEDGAPSGLGLGFFIAKTLLERSGAELTLENRPGPEEGAIVRVTWPRRAYEPYDASAKDWRHDAERMPGALGAPPPKLPV
jgi:two-component system sensor histidine kinase RegB